MSYSVKVDEAVRRKIAEWQLPRSALQAILERLDQLRNLPSQSLIRVESSIHSLQSDLVVHDPGPPPRDHLIVLSVRYGVDEETLYIVDCDRLVEDRLPE